MPSTKLLSAAAALAFIFAAGRAEAQTCTDDAACPSGFACVDTGVVTPQPSCPPDAACPKTEPSTTTVKLCQAKACDRDSDCGAGMVCHSETSTTCSGGGAVPPCAPNTKCDAPVPTTPDDCRTTTVKACAFKWQLPCSASADCGDGFECQPSVVGACSGGGASSTGSTTPPPPPPTCTTMTTFPGTCQPKVTTCTTDSQCPPSWKCSANQAGTAVASPPASGGPATPSTTTTTAPPTPVPDMAATRSCVSPFGIVATAGDRGVSSSGTAPAPATPGLPGTGASGPTPSPVPPTSTPTAQPEQFTPSRAAGGCAVGSGAVSPQGGSALLLLLGLVLARRRR
jgi:MYXO-CTERM domain-containing protein